MTDTPTSIKAIDHLAFITPDLPKTIRFYRDLLEMELCAGVGHGGYRHYFFRFGANMVAFFEYEGAREMNRKNHGVKSELPLGFDHVSFTVDTVEDLFYWKDRLEAAGVEVNGVVDHGTIWSIYFFDPNNIPLEISWPCMDIHNSPAITDDRPLAIAAEGANAQPGHWPEVTNPTPRSEFKARGGNGFDMRDAALRDGTGSMKPALKKLLGVED